MNDWTFAAVDDGELHDVLSGHTRPIGPSWPYMKLMGHRPGQIGVLVSADDGRIAPPACLVVSSEASRRLFGRYSQLRSDLSPLSAWTHILDWDQLERLADGPRVPEFEGLDAAWVGLIIAEALMMSERPLAQLKLAACLATPSYAIARARGLWGNEAVSSILARYDHCHKLVRGVDVSSHRLRTALTEIWEVLSDVSHPIPRGGAPELRPLAEALLSLQRSRERQGGELDLLLDRLDLPFGHRWRSLESMPAELRVREFDRIIDEIERLPEADVWLRHRLFFFAGYVATIAAGGAPSLSLAERLQPRYPQITAWAYVIGGVGERTTWASGFDGLGRLVARELQRPFRLDEAPTCDFAVQEASVLVDSGLKDPLVHLRIKQARVLTVSLLPGVQVSVPMNEAPSVTKLRSPAEADVKSQLPARDPMRILAQALVPYLLEELSPSGSAPPPVPRRGARSRSPKRQDQMFPLDDEDDGSR